MLYIVSGRLNAEGFVVASLLDRPFVPIIMAVLWSNGILPGPLAVAFSLTDFAGFLWTAFAWREDVRHGQNIGGPGQQGQTRAARSVELFGWLIMALGSATLIFPSWMQSLLTPACLCCSRSELLPVGRITGRRAGSAVYSQRKFEHAGLGFRFIAGATRGGPDHPGSVAERSAWLARLCLRRGRLAWVLVDARRLAQRFSLRREPRQRAVPARWAAGFFGFVSGVIRNARTFHPDGRVFRGTVRSLEPSDPNLARAAEQLHGAVLMRIGMGMLKRGMPRWLADHIPDAPSIASRFFTPAQPSEIRLERRSGQDLDLLCTAGGDRLWKLLLNLATGGRKYGLHQFDYFRNAYHSDVPYKLDGGKADVWVRLMPESGAHQLGCSASRRRAARASPYQCRGEPCACPG